MIKYAVYPGTVTSKSDGQVHFIGASELCALYRVSLSECRVVHQTDFLDSAARKYLESLISLTPRYDGNYSIESVK